MRNRHLVGLLPLLLCAAALGLVVAPVHGAGPITVTTTSDSIADDGFCSLREAVIAANTDNSFHDCPAGSGADTIVFDAQLPRPVIITLTLTGADEDAAETGDLDVSGTLAIVGETPDAIVIDGDAADRVFEALQASTLGISGVTIRHGSAPVGANGGGVLVDLAARLTLTDSVVISSSATSGGGLYSVGGLTIVSGTVAGNQGGGVTNDGGLLALKQAIVAGNTGGYGVVNEGQGSLTFTSGVVSANEGGIYNVAATATVSDVQIAGNTAGGIYNSGFSPTHLTLARSAVLSNTAVSGAGILNEGVGAKVDVIDSRVGGNEASASGGGLFNNGIMVVRGSTVDHNRARAGSGIHHFGGNLSVINATVTQNTASDNGGGLYNHGSATLQYVTLSGNSAGGSGNNIFIDEAPLSIGSSIVAEAGAAGNCTNSGGFLTSLGHNVESADTCTLAATADLTDTQPLLGALGDNGGPTATEALLAGSPAMDRGAAASCPAADQRGVARPVGAGCDSGAYEVSGAEPTPTATPTETPTATPEPTVTSVPPLPLAIAIEPAAPTTSDPVSITVTGVFTTSCTPAYQSHQVTGHEINIQGSVPDQSFCLNIETPFSYTVGVGPLAAGIYTATNTIEQRTDSKVFAVTEAGGQCGTGTEEESSEESSWFLPALPMAAAKQLYLVSISREPPAACR
ncbi:MAG: choice-of-anchor Q domain-containing protein [Caldilineaceae bacterium]